MYKFALVLAFLFLSASVAQAKTWNTDYKASSISFTGKQSGKEFTGKFKNFYTTIDFDLNNPSSGRITATIDVTSASTGQSDIDDSLPQSDWFNTQVFPKAEFVSRSITADKSPNCYNAAGKLTIKSITKDVNVAFCLTPEGDFIHAKGSATLIRNDFLVGTGAWEASNLVARDVLVNLDIFAK